ncbi:hypothetical protein ABZ543_13205 [Streptomyces roseifaciens]
MEFTATGDTASARLMEAEGWQLATSLAHLGFHLMGHAVFPLLKVEESTPWLDVDRRMRSDAEFADAWRRREFFRSQAQPPRFGYLPKLRCRVMAQEIIAALCFIHAGLHKCQNCPLLEPMAKVVSTELSKFRTALSSQPGE